MQARFEWVPCGWGRYITTVISIRITFRTQTTNTSTTTKYANVAYDPLTYNMVSATLTIDSNSK